MIGLGADNWLAAVAVWAMIMLPTAAFGGHDGRKSRPQMEVAGCGMPSVAGRDAMDLRVAG